MSIARGIASAFSGFERGLRLAHDEDEFQQRKKAREMQMEKDAIALEEAKKEQAYKDDIRRFGEQKMKEMQGGVEGEVVDEFGVNLGTQRYYGANRPEAMGMSFASDPKQIAPRDFNDMSVMEEIIRGQQSIAVKHGRYKPLEAIEMAQKFEKAKTEGVLEAGRIFLETKDPVRAAQVFNSRGGMKLPEGATFHPTEEKVFPGTDIDIKAPGFEIRDKDGNKITDWSTILRNTLPTNELLRRDTDLAKALAEYRTKMEEAKANTLHRQQMLATANRQAVAAEAGARSAEEVRRLAAVSQAVDRTIKTGDIRLASAYGYKPIDPNALLSEEEKRAYTITQRRYGAASSIHQMNIDLETGKAGITPADARQIEEMYFRVYTNPAAADELRSKIKEDENGTYMMINGRRANVPPLPAPPQAQQGTPKQTSAPARSGINPPLGDEKSKYVRTPGPRGGYAYRIAGRGEFGKAKTMAEWRAYDEAGSQQ